MSKLYSDLLLLTDQLLNAAKQNQDFSPNSYHMKKDHAMKYLLLINGGSTQNLTQHLIENNMDDVSLIHRVRKQIKELQAEREAIQRLSLYAE